MPHTPIYLSKADLARRHIEGLILSRAIKPGDRITTREISDAMGISETPIREAMRSLAAEGWLDIQPHVGAVVASAGRDQLQEIYALRGLIGALALELGASNYDERLLAELDANIDASAVVVGEGDVQGYKELNQQFHALLYDTPQSQWCLRLLTNLSALTAVHYGFTIKPERMAESLIEHRGIVDALRLGDHAHAATLVKQHELSACEALAKELETDRTGRFEEAL